MRIIIRTLSAWIALVAVPYAFYIKSLMWDTATQTVQVRFETRRDVDGYFIYKSVDRGPFTMVKNFAIGPDSLSSGPSWSDAQAEPNHNYTYRADGYKGASVQEGQAKGIHTLQFSALALPTRVSAGTTLGRVQTKPGRWWVKSGRNIFLNPENGLFDEAELIEINESGAPVSKGRLRVGGLEGLEGQVLAVLEDRLVLVVAERIHLIHMVNGNFVSLGSAILEWHDTRAPQKPSLAAGFWDDDVLVVLDPFNFSRYQVGTHRVLAFHVGASGLRSVDISDRTYEPYRPEITISPYDGSETRLFAFGNRLYADDARGDFDRRFIVYDFAHKPVIANQWFSGTDSVPDFRMPRIASGYTLEDSLLRASRHVFVETGTGRLIRIAEDGITVYGQGTSAIKARNESWGALRFPCPGKRRDALGRTLRLGEPSARKALIGM